MLQILISLLKWQSAEAGRLRGRNIISSIMSPKYNVSYVFIYLFIFTNNAIAQTNNNVIINSTEKLPKYRFDFFMLSEDIDSMKYRYINGQTKDDSILFQFMILVEGESNWKSGKRIRKSQLLKVMDIASQRFNYVSILPFMKLIDKDAIEKRSSFCGVYATKQLSFKPYCSYERLCYNILFSFLFFLCVLLN